MFLDHLSHGRLNVCFGPGAIPTDMEVFGAHLSESTSARRRIDRADMIMRARSGELPVDIRGRFWNVTMKDNSAPRVRRRTSPQTVPAAAPPDLCPMHQSGVFVGPMKAAERGFRFISHQRTEPRERFAGAVGDVFASRGCGRSISLGPRTGPLPGTCSSRTRPTRPAARRRGNSLGSSIQVHPRPYPRDRAQRAWPCGGRDDQQAESDCTLDYFLDEVIIAGDPEHVTNQLLELRERIGRFGTLVLTAHDWDDRDRWTHHLELFAREVIPAFNKAIGAAS